MSGGKHTPGPWVRTPHGDLIGSDGTRVTLGRLEPSERMTFGLELRSVLIAELEHALTTLIAERRVMEAECARCQRVGDLIVSRKDLADMMDKADRVETLEAERRVMVEALEFYAVAENYSYWIGRENFSLNSRVMSDRGQRARTVLTSAQSQPSVAREPISRADTEASAKLEGALTVETAAIRVGNAVFTLPRPNRHHNIIWWLSALGIESDQMHDQGFALNTGQYVSRTLAAKIALGSGQVAGLHAPPNLFSEDLWDGGADLPTPDEIHALTSPTGHTTDRQLSPRDAQKPDQRGEGG